MERYGANTRHRCCGDHFTNGFVQMREGDCFREMDVCSCFGCIGKKKKNLNQRLFRKVTFLCNTTLSNYYFE